jgi:hypothetical protein
VTSVAEHANRPILGFRKVHQALLPQSMLQTRSGIPWRPREEPKFGPRPNAVAELRRRRPGRRRRWSRVRAGGRSPCQGRHDAHGSARWLSPPLRATTWLRRRAQRQLTPGPGGRSAPRAAPLAVAAAAGRPAGRGHLHHHPARTVRAVPGRFQRPAQGTPLVPAGPGRRPALVAERGVGATHRDGPVHRVWFSALTGMESSPSRSMSDSAGRPSVVR